MKKKAVRTKKSRFFSGLLVGVMCLNLLAGIPMKAEAAVSGNATFPTVQSYAVTSGSFALSAGSRILLIGEKNAQVEKDMELLRREFVAKGLVTHFMGIVYGTEADAQAGDIVVNMAAISESRKAEAYKIEIGNYAKVTAPNADGIFYGVRTIQKTLLGHDGLMQQGTIVDYPAVPVRSFHLDAARKSFTKNWVIALIKDLSYQNYNSLQFHFSENEGYRLESSTLEAISGFRYPSDGHFTKADIREIVEVCKQYHIDFVPSLDSPGHMRYVLNYLPASYKISSLSQFAGDARCQQTFNIFTNPDAKRILTDLFSEYAGFFGELGVKHMNIGGDEFLDNFGLMSQTEYQQLIAYFNEIAGIVKAQGITPRAWNDGLMYGNYSGYNLDSDIEICYWAGPQNCASIEKFVANGNKVMNYADVYMYYVLGSWWMSAANPVASKIYNEWTPGKLPTLANQPNLNQPMSYPYPDSLLGASYAVWCDTPSMLSEGQIASNIYERTRATAERSWNPGVTASYNDFETYFNKLGRVAGYEEELPEPGKVVKNNYALASNGAVASVKTVEVNYQWGPANLNDGVVNRSETDKPKQSRWSSEKGFPQWVQIDLGRKRVFDELNLAWENEEQLATKYYIEVSDNGQDGSWRRIFTAPQKDDGYPLDDVIKLDEAVCARYVKLVIEDKLATSDWRNASLYEIRVLGELPVNAEPAHLVLNYVRSDGSLIQTESSYIQKGASYNIDTKLSGYTFISADAPLTGTCTQDEMVITLKYRSLVDKSDLEAEMNPEFLEEEYIAETFAAYKEAFAHAKEVLADENANSDMIDEAYCALVDAKKKAVRLNRLELYLEVKNPVPADGYTTGSYESYRSQVTDGQEVLYNQEASKQEVANALAAIRQAKDGLTRPEISNRDIKITATLGTYATGGSWPYANMLDGNRGTHAWFEGGQEVGQEIRFEFPEVVDMKEIRIQAPLGEANDYIRSADVEVSTDGQNWEKVGEIKGILDTTVSAGQKAKYVRIKLTEEDTHWYKVAEVIFSYDRIGADKTALKEKYEELLALNLAEYTKDSVAGLTEALGTAAKALNAIVTQDEVDHALQVLMDAESRLEQSYIVYVNDVEAARGLYNTKVVLKAPAPEKEGEKFLAWEVDGKVVSTESTYTFYLSNTVHMKAVFGPEDGVKEQTEAAMLSSVQTIKRTDDKSDIRFVGQLVLPKGYRLVNAGLIWSTKEEAEVPLIVGGGLNAKLNPTYITAISNTNQFSVTIKGLPTGMSLRGRIFATVIDGAGNQKLLYSKEGEAAK